MTLYSSLTARSRHHDLRPRAFVCKAVLNFLTFYVFIKTSIKSTMFSCTKENIDIDLHRLYILILYYILEYDRR